MFPSSWCVVGLTKIKVDLCLCNQMDFCNLYWVFVTRRTLYVMEILDSACVSFIHPFRVTFILFKKFYVFLSFMWPYRSSAPGPDPLLSPPGSWPSCHVIAAIFAAPRARAGSSAAKVQLTFWLVQAHLHPARPLLFSGAGHSHTQEVAIMLGKYKMADGGRLSRAFGCYSMMFVIDYAK